MASVTLSELHGRLQARVETVSGFKLSTKPLSPISEAATLQDKRFGIEFDTTNSGLYRDRTSGPGVRLEHDVAIRFLRRLPPKNQKTRYLDALDNEVAIIRALMAQTGSWQEDLRVLYGSSTREVLEGGEWLLSTLTFSIAHNLELT